MTQVSKEHYRFSKYADEARFASYYHQLKEILDASPASVVDIGVGDGVVGDYLRRRGSVEYVCVDYAADLNPDVVAGLAV